MKKLQSKYAAVLLALVWGLGSVTSLNAETANPSSQQHQSTDQAEAKQKEKDNFGLKPHPRLADDPNIIDMPGHLKLAPLDMDRRDITGIIVRLRENAHPPKIETLSPEEMVRIKGAAGMELTFGRAIWGNHYLLTLPREMSRRETEEIARRIESLPEVEYSEPNYTGFGLQAVPNDPHFSTRQWSLKSDMGGMKVDKAWDLTTGDSGIVVAVIDGGILATHEDIVGRLVSGTPAGYDFVTNTQYSNDGNGRDADSSDPGDWVSATEAGIGAFTGCATSSSTWHGTFVAGIIGAAANNAKGIAGINWNSKILPVRVFGKCPDKTGNATDIAEAITWAAGLASSPSNPNPARVINMSFAAPGACSATLQSVINAAYKKRVVLVAGAGNNDGANVSGYQPANCKNVISVAAVTRQGGLASYSNKGAGITISAPGGERTGDVLDRITSLSNTGAMGPVSNTYAINEGTSFAAPHVSGVVSLMLSAQPKLRLKNLEICLKNTSGGFPTNTSSNCDNSICGAGIVDAEQAVMAARATQAGGIYHTAAVKSDGTVVAWGYNGNGQLGGGEAFGIVRAYPGTPIASLSNMRDVATGGYHTAASKGDGTVWSWGYNGKGQLGNGTLTDSTNPVQATGLTNVIAVAGGDLHTLALKADGTVWAWGYNFFGQLGRAPFNFTDSPTPVQVYGLTDVIAIAGAGKRSLALKKDGTVWAWGAESNVTSDTSATIYSAPLQVAGLTDVVAIAAGGDATTGVDTEVSMALTWDGKVYTWGYNSSGQLGLGHTTTKFLPKEVTSLPKPAVSISTSGMHSLAILEDGSQWAWGSNSGGMLGDGTTTSRSSPVQVVGALAKVIDVTAARFHTLALHGDLTVHAWGNNSGGQLGEGTQTSRTTPQLVHGASNAGIYNAGYATSTRADMGIVLSDSPDPALTGANLTYDLQLINYGPDTATGVSAVLSLPSQATFVSATTGCSYANASVTCTRTSLNSAANAAFQVVVKPISTATLNATASVSSGIYDPATSNNVAGTSTVASAAAPSNGDVPLPAWALVLLGAGLLKTLRGHQLRASS